MSEIAGNIVPYLTLFDEQGRVDLTAMELLFRATVKFVDVAFVGGGTGQGYMLHPRELADIVKVAKQVFQEKPVIAAVWQGRSIQTERGMFNREGSEYVTALRDASVDRLVIPPPISQEAGGRQSILAYLTHLSLTIEGNRVILYNNPGLTNHHLTMDLTRHARDILAVEGYKDSSGSIEFVDDLIANFYGKLDLHIGSEAVFAAVAGNERYKGKFKGIVGSTGNVAAKFMKQLWVAYLDGHDIDAYGSGRMLVEALPYMNGPNNSEIIPRLTHLVNEQGIGRQSPYNEASEEARLYAGIGLRILNNA